jgi:geranylgeranyl pyrophosphate synthase
MDSDAIIRPILELPEIAAWSDLSGFIGESAESPPADWTLPLLACRSVCGTEEPALPGASALACLQMSIILVDDILDDDPSGDFHLHGVGRVSNYALALQAAAFKLLTGAGIVSNQAGMIIAKSSSVALETARGQHLDSGNYGDESDYWTVVTSKSTPFYGLALEIGAILGGADSRLSDKFWDAGLLLGEIIQLHDDLVDVFEIPPKPDWDRPRNNLLILYALTAEHDEREKMAELLNGIEDPRKLNEAQKILLKSGAVSYCAYHVIQRHNELRGIIGEMDLLDDKPMLELMKLQADPIRALLHMAGVSVPELAVD